MKFVSFHTHSTFSFGDGFGSPEEHVLRVKELGMSALALSEHGNVSSHVQLEQAAKAHGIKPIFGIEAYFAPTSEEKKSQSKTHLTIFAMDQQGYNNLNKLVTQSWLDFYQKPTVSWQNLVKHNAGIAVFSGCADSLASCTYLGGKFLGPRIDPKRMDDRGFAEAAEERLCRVLLRFADVFQDRFYLECQRFPGLDRTRAINSAFGRISARTGIPLIATADVHYPYPYQNVMQTALHAAHRDGTVATTDADWEYDILLTYPESDFEIYKDLRKTGLCGIDASRAILNTRRLAERCNVELPKAAPLRFPGVDLSSLSDYRTPDREEARKTITRKFMWDKLKEGWKYRCEQRPELKKRAREYNAALQKEMKVIGGKDFMDYFLVNADLVSYTKDRGKGVGPARGSVAGSVVAYLMRITEIDPLHPVWSGKMIFERFLDESRDDPPDIDLDFDDEARPVMVGRAVEVYSRDNVANVGNHMKYRGVSALNHMAKAHALPEKTFEAIKDRISDRAETDERVDDSVLDVLESYADVPQVAELIEKYWKTELNDEVREGPLELATWLEGNNIGLGVHAAGFVIGDRPITDVCPIYSRDSGTGRKKKKVTVIPYDKRDAEYLNLLKNDFLGLKTIGVIRKACEQVGLTMNDMYLLYPEVGDLRDYDHTRPIIERFLSDDLVGIFQFEGGTTRSVVSDVRPTEFRHLADISALSRPGPKYGGQTERYVAVKAGESEIELIHPLYDQHVAWTYGQIVYQEQIMFILRDLAGFPMPQVTKVRKIIGKKLGEHQFKKHWEDFKNGCAANGVDEDRAAVVWSYMTSAAGYAFNTPHAYSYTWISWWAMWLKVHHPTALYAELLTANGDGKKQKSRRTALIQDANRHDIAVLPVDPTHSGIAWTKDSDHAIRPGFAQIPGIAEAVSGDIIAWREAQNVYGQSDFEWDSLKAVKGIGPKTLERMKSFATVDDPFGVYRVSRQLGAFRAQMAQGDYDNTPLPDATEFYMSDEFPDDDHIAWVGFVANKDFRDEVEGIHKKTGQTVAEIKAEMKDPHLTSKLVMFGYDENGECALRVNRWRLPDLVDTVDNIVTDHHVVVAWGKVYEGKGKSIQVKALWILTPD